MNFTQKSDTVVNVKTNIEGLGTSEKFMSQPHVTEVEIDEDVIITNAKTVADDAARENESECSHTAEESGEAPLILKKRMQTRAEMATSQVGGPLSMHVLDTARGNPVSALKVSLYKLIDGQWTHISEGLTNPDGRYTNFIQKADFTAGCYKLHFEVDC